MKFSLLAPLAAAALAAALCTSGAHASRLEKPEATPFNEGMNNVCAGCRVYVQSTRGGPVRLDRRPAAMLAEGSSNVCTENGVVPWFPEEGEHLSAFLNSQATDLK